LIKLWLSATFQDLVKGKHFLLQPILYIDPKLFLKQ